MSAGNVPAFSVNPGFQQPAKSDGMPELGFSVLTLRDYRNDFDTLPGSELP
jgi:hypothetical protein